MITECYLKYPHAISHFTGNKPPTDTDIADVSRHLERGRAVRVHFTDKDVITEYYRKLKVPYKNVLRVCSENKPLYTAFIFKI